MPRVLLTESQRADQYVRDVKAEILVRLNEMHITKTALAEYAGMSKQVFNERFKTMNFDVKEMYLIRKKLRMEDL